MFTLLMNLFGFCCLVFPIQPGLVRKDSQIEFRALARRDAENALINELEKLQASAPEKELQVSE